MFDWLGLFYYFDIMKWGMRFLSFEVDIGRVMFLFRGVLIVYSVYLEE